MTKNEKAAAARMTREDVEAAVRELCIASVRLDETVARMNLELARVREHYEPEIAAWQQTVDEQTEIVRAWADAHPEEFASRKSIVMVHGTLGYRVGQPALKTIRGVTWDKVLAILRHNLPHYVRIKEEVDREAILADRESLGDENLKTLGLRVEQAERFYVEPNKESVKAAMPAESR
ncbi:host-nuclease inhibitor Gam family protein [Thermosphaera sp.]